MNYDKELPQTSTCAHRSSSQPSFFGYATLSPFQLRLYLLKRLGRIFLGKKKRP